VQGTWHLLRWAWTAVVIVYLLLEVFAAKRLRGKEQKRSTNILIVMVVLVAIRIGIRVFFGSSLAYRFAVMVVGIAGGISALVLAKMLIDPKEFEGSDTQGAEEHFQSLKLH
jgi:hypothetical protein